MDVYRPSYHKKKPAAFNAKGGPLRRGVGIAAESIGIGEMTMVSTAPAIANAISNACGIRIRDLPATPEKIMGALAALKKGC